MDWQANLIKVSNRTEYLLKSGQWSDCSFVVGAGESKETLHAHKLLLAMASPVFEAMFYGEMADVDNKPIEILDVQPRAFKALLHYIYTDNIKLDSFDQVCEICYGAKKYMIPHLVDQCTKYILSGLNPANVCPAFEFARLFEEPNLQEKCLNSIRTQTVAIMRDPSFKRIDVSTLRTILLQDTLEVSELQLWEAAVRWSRDECIRQSLEVTPVNQRKVLSDNIYLFRFLCLSPTEFANGPALSGILTQEESFSLLMNISSMGVATVPTSFCSSTTRRKPPSTPPKSRSSSSNKEPGQQYCPCTGIATEILLNDQLVDCSISFSVDKTVFIYGVVMPTQLKPIECKDKLPHSLLPPSSQPSTSSHSSSNKYCELIYAFLQGDCASRLTYTHFTARVSFDSTMEVLFNRPVCINSNKSYKIVVVLNKVGRYPMYENLADSTLDNVTFNFSDSHRLGLIKSLIFANTNDPLSSESLH